MGPAGGGYRLVDVDLSRGEIGLLDKAGGEGSEGEEGGGSESLGRLKD